MDVTHPPRRNLLTSRNNAELELGGPRAGRSRKRTDAELELGGPRVSSWIATMSEVSSE